MKVSIIGAGMAGSILAKLLRKEGIEFNIFDSEREGAASRVSENLIGLDWYKDVHQSFRMKSQEILSSIVPVRMIHSNGKAFYHVQTDDLLEKDYIIGDAIPTGLAQLNCVGHGNFYGLNVICAGYWSKFITTGLKKMTASVGHGIIYPGQTEEFIQPYKPFRFEKLINRTKDEIWYSNSMSVNLKTYDQNKLKYIAELYDGAGKIPNLNSGQYKIGYRPKFENGHMNLLNWNGLVITGGNKSGLLHYPIQCAEAVKYIKSVL